jgi:hypothetical protein
MKKVCVLAMVLCLGLGASVWAADMPGQKLTDAEAASIRGAAFIFPANVLSTSVCKVIVNNQTPQTSPLIGNSVNTGTLLFTGATVAASGTFTR